MSTGETARVKLLWNGYCHCNTLPRQSSNLHALNSTIPATSDRGTQRIAKPTPKCNLWTFEEHCALCKLILVLWNTWNTDSIRLIESFLIGWKATHPYRTRRKHERNSHGCN